MAYQLTTNIKTADSPSLDAFGRFRVSNPFTIFDSKQLFDSQPTLWDDDEETGSGTSSSHSTDTSATTISVSDSISGKRTRQTFMRFNYQPGKSFLIMLTGILATTGSGTGNTFRIGYFDDNNGIFFEDHDETLRVVRRTSTSGSPVDNAVAQSSWNLDTLDGSGLSGVTLDKTKTQIFVIDFQWLGVGRVRMGVVVNGVLIYCHEFLNSNVLDTVYMSTPNLPLRYQIENNGSGDAGSMDQICCTIVSEGGVEDNGALHYQSTGDNSINANTVGTWYVVCGLRLKTGGLS